MLRVPFTGDEKQSLQASMDRHRAVVRWKVEGLSEEAIRKPLTPSGLTMGGVVKHLASVEFGWFCSTFGRPSEEIEFHADDPDADWRVEPDETLADVLDYYGRACAAADAVIGELELTDTGRSWNGDTVTLRWVLIHMIEETARHCGHLDIARELLDGTTGDHPE